MPGWTIIGSNRVALVYKCFDLCPRLKKWRLVLEPKSCGLFHKKENVIELAPHVLATQSRRSYHHSFVSLLIHFGFRRLATCFAFLRTSACWFHYLHIKLLLNFFFPAGDDVAPSSYFGQHWILSLENETPMNFSNARNRDA